MLMSAVGVTSLAVYAPLDTDSANKILYGILHSALALLLIYYTYLEKIFQANNLGTSAGLDAYLVAISDSAAVRSSVGRLVV